MYIGCARNADDRYNALKLSTEIFQEENNDSLSVKKSSISPFNLVSDEDVVIIADDNNLVIGACFLINRYLFYGELKVKGTFLSSICIAESSRGLGLSKDLMNEAIVKCEQRGSIFAILIARRSADYYYNQFSFWGLSQYSLMKLNLKKNQVVDQSYSISEVTEKSLTLVNDLFISTYSKLYGSFIRDLEYWKYILWATKNQKFKFSIFKYNGKIVGYAIYKGSEIYEISVASESLYIDFLNRIGRFNSTSDFLIHAPASHPLANELQLSDFSMIKRQCSYGGHMVRVLDKSALLKLRQDELQKEACELGINDWYEMCGDHKIVIKNGTLEVRFPCSEHSYEGTCFLMNADRLSSSNKTKLGNKLAFNILYFDQI